MLTRTGDKLLAKRFAPASRILKQQKILFPGNPGRLQVVFDNENRDIVPVRNDQRAFDAGLGEDIMIAFDSPAGKTGTLENSAQPLRRDRDNPGHLFRD